MAEDNVSVDGEIAGLPAPAAVTKLPGIIVRFVTSGSTTFMQVFTEDGSIVSQKIV